MTSTTRALRQLERTASDVQVALHRVRKSLPEGEFDGTTLDAVRNAAQKLGEAARESAGALANTAYETGGRAVERVQSKLQENWMEFAIGGGIGFALGLLIGRQMAMR
jgi:ElaB/YqjD/DUF883 family membrane-anchored ribosome-binding protein